jgi:hypothetical protein
MGKKQNRSDRTTGDTRRERERERERERKVVVVAICQKF